MQIQYIIMQVRTILNTRIKNVTKRYTYSMPTWNNTLGSLVPSSAKAVLIVKVTGAQFRGGTLTKRVRQPYR